MSLQQTKTLVQQRAKKAWVDTGCNGVVAMATGTGKSKIFVDLVMAIAKVDKDSKFVIVVPTQKLRDKNWKEEFEKWGALELWDSRVIKTCYASLKKISGEKLALVGLDECHRLTDRQKVFFDQNTVLRCIGLTATMPEDASFASMEKRRVFREVGLRVIFIYDILSAIKEGVVAPFEITLITMKLDNTKIQRLGYKGLTRTTEKQFYEDMENKILLSLLHTNKDTTNLRNARAMFLKNVPSKKYVGRSLVRRLKGRFLVFCSSKEQSEFATDGKVYHSSSGDKFFNAFVNGELDILGAVEGLNEGHSLPDMDGILILHMTTKERDFLQRLGRAIRYRDNFVAQIYILSIEGTKDIEWTRKVLRKIGLKYKTFKLEDSYVQKHFQEGHN